MRTAVFLPSPAGGGAGGEGTAVISSNAPYQRSSLTPALSRWEREGTALFLATLLLAASAHATPVQDFAHATTALSAALHTYCAAPGSDLTQPRQHWLTTLTAWERYSAVALGPVLERRAQRQLDFSPTRPRLIEKAVKAAPKMPADMELIGAPAKGLPALEWLLWVKPIQPGAPDCTYAVQVATELDREAAALANAPHPKPALTDLVNQWVAGLERLRWAQMELPLRAALTSDGKEAPDYPRRASGATALAWTAQWAALRDRALGAESLTSALTEKGKPTDALRTAIAQADAAMNGLKADNAERVLAAARELAALKRLVEDQVAPVLEVVIGFSDADGD